MTRSDQRRGNQVDERDRNSNRKEWEPAYRLGQQPVIDFQIQKLLIDSMSSLMNLSAQQLRRAAAIKENIQSLENELNHILGSSETVSTAVVKPKRKMSAAARARIAAGQKARWAKVKGSKSAMAPAQKPKRQMSAAAKAKISAAAKARWVKIRAAKKS